MRVSFLKNINTSYRLNKTPQKPYLRANIAGDCFVKSSCVSHCGSVNQTEPWTENRMKKLYDEVFEDFKNDTPVLSELSYEKPLFLDIGYDGDKLASYGFANNCITITPYYKEDCYVTNVYLDNNDSLVPRVKVGKNLLHDYIISCRANNHDVKVSKLNDKEKELYWKSTLAHELRHSMQHHILFSTEGCADIMRKRYKECENAINNTVKEVSDGWLNKILSFSEYLYAIETIDNIQNSYTPYYLNSYVPKRILSPDTLIRAEELEKDRYWSVKNHWLKAYKGNEDYDYYSDPKEIDACGYQFSYLLNHFKEYGLKDSKNIRDIAINLVIDYAKRLDDMKKAGYPDIITRLPDAI